MKALYRPIGFLVSVLGGLAAGALFNKVWKSIADEDEAPQPEQADRSWREIAAAAALQGAVTATVRALISRGGLKGFEKATGVWAGESKAA
ncbi:MAG TPA: DUF4235 domain-containing protein [Acidimicrobiia bacterium]|jgi:hypothetical protein|nr:DUF4235 domain-containing protein [Acidimicrobiia bacterium]